jgi:hypothetical protein
MVAPLGDVLQPVVLGLEILQLVVDPLEGVFRKIPGKRSTFCHVVSRLGPAEDAEEEVGESWVSGNSEANSQVRMEGLPE